VPAAFVVHEPISAYTFIGVVLLRDCTWYRRGKWFKKFV